MTFDPTNDLASVVIPTFNRKAILAQVINPLLDDPYTGEVIVVVDGSTDGSYEFIERWTQENSRVRAIFQENAGPAAARRRGIEASRHDVVVLIDDDVVATAGLIGAHFERHRGSNNLLVIGYMPPVVPPVRRRGQIANILYAQDYEDACRRYESNEREILTHLWAGNYSLRRAQAIKISGRDEKRLQFHEDLRFGLRCEEFGLEPVFDRSLLASHWRSRSLREYANDCRRSGRSSAQINREFPTMAAKLSVSRNLKERFIMRYLAARYVSRVSASFAIASSYISGWVGAWRLETISTRVLQLIENSAGYKTYDPSVDE